MTRHNGERPARKVLSHEQMAFGVALSRYQREEMAGLWKGVAGRNLGSIRQILHEKFIVNMR